MQRDTSGADGSFATEAIRGSTSVDPLNGSTSSQRDTSFKIMRSTVPALTDEMVQAMIQIESEHRRRGFKRNGASLAKVLGTNLGLRACLAYHIDATGSTEYLGFALAHVGIESYLWELHVFATHWKLGIGGKLLQMMIGDGACKLQVHTENHVARRFYERHDFQMDPLEVNMGVKSYYRGNSRIDSFAPVAMSLGPGFTGFIGNRYVPTAPSPSLLDKEGRPLRAPQLPPSDLQTSNVPSRLQRIPSSIPNSMSTVGSLSNRSVERSPTHLAQRRNSDLAIHFSKQVDSSAPLRGPARYGVQPGFEPGLGSITREEPPDRFRPMSKRPNLNGASPVWRVRTTPADSPCPSESSQSDQSERLNDSPACSQSSTANGFETLETVRSLPLDFSTGSLLPQQDLRSSSVCSSSASHPQILPFRGLSTARLQRPLSVRPAGVQSSGMRIAPANDMRSSPSSNSNMLSSSSSSRPPFHSTNPGPLIAGIAITNRSIGADATGRPRSASAPTSRQGTEGIPPETAKPTRKREPILAQRDVKNLYRTDYFYPSGVSESVDDDSCELASKWICTNCYGCTGTCCLLHVSALQIYKARCSFRSANVNRTLLEGMASRLATVYDQTTKRWGKLCVQTGNYTSTHLCVSSFGLFCGVSSKTLRDAMDRVRNGNVSKFVPAVDARFQTHLDYAMIESYVRYLVNHSGECNPAPGAHQDGRTTHVVKQTWNEKWTALLVYFKDSSHTPGSKTMLRRVWNREKRLKERRANSHSKCNTCSQIDKKLFGLVGQVSEEAIADRKRYGILKKEHDVKHLRGRMELDDAGLMATVNPRYMWTLMADAATQRNFEMPKGSFRTPKELAGKPLWSYKLMAVFAYGFGFMPFLIHNSQTMGANLTWTVLWLALCKMRSERGYWPQVYTSVNIHHAQYLHVYTFLHS